MYSERTNVYEKPRGGLYGLYEGGKRFSLAGVNPNCGDPAYATAYPDQCGGSGNAPAPTADANGFDWNALVQTVLNDATQIIRPNTPQLRPVYTPASTAATSLFNNPVVLGLFGVGLYLAFRKGR